MHSKHLKKTTDNSNYHHGNLRQALVDAALDILKEKGIQALSLRGVARHAGVSQTAPYSHFKDKQGLLAAVATKGFYALSRTMEQECLGAITEKEKMLALARGYVNFATRQRALFQLMFGNEIGERKHFPELAEAGSACHRLLANAVAEVLDAHESPKTTQPIATLAAWSLVHGLSILLLDGQVSTEELAMPDQDALVETVASLLTLA